MALFADGSLAVSDAAHNRILLFRRPTGGDFTTGQAAAVVLGQSDFTTINTSTGLTGLSSPRHLSVDTSDRLYVADAGNNRVMVFPRAMFSANGVAAAFGITGFNNPQSIAVSPVTGEIWVTNSGANQIVRFPEYQQLVLNPSTVNSVLGSAGPMTVALDPFDNIIVAEASNRLTFYYAKLTYQHAASYNQQPLSPGQLAYL